MVGHEPTAREPDRNADRAAGSPDRHDAAALFFRKVVGDKRSAGWIVAGLTDADSAAAEEQLDVVGGQSGEQRRKAPDGDSDPDHRAAYSAIAPVAEGKGGDRIHEEKRGPEEPDLGIVNVELFLDQRRRGGGDPAIQVVEEVDADHDRKDVTRVASRHGDILWAGCAEKPLARLRTITAP